jgi:hypothetical protein
MKKLLRIIDLMLFGYDAKNAELEILAARLADINKIISR